MNESIERIRVVAAIIERGDRVLVCRRPRHKRHGGLWEFPGGKVEPAEDDLNAVRRELREELGVDVVHVDPETFRIDDHGSSFTIAFVRTVIVGEPRALEHDELLWATAHDLSVLELAPSDREYVRFRLNGTHADGRTR
jgi:mutator protein MutT